MVAGFFRTAPTGNTGNGTSNNTLTYVDLQGHTFNRQVNSVNTAIVFDQQSGSLARAKSRPTLQIQTSNFAKPRLPGGRGRP